MWCAPVPYQPLPISTGNVGIDRCGQVQVYAAPRVVHAKCTLWREWPAHAWPPHRPFGCGCGCGSFSNALAAVLTGGCPT